MITQLYRGDAFTVVTHRNPHKRLLFLSADLHRFARGAELNRVIQQMPQRARQRQAVSQDRRQIRREDEVQVHLASRRQRGNGLDNVLAYIGDGDRFESQALLLHRVEVHDVLHHLLQPLNRLLRNPQAFRLSRCQTAGDPIG